MPHRLITSAVTQVQKDNPRLRKDHGQELKERGAARDTKHLDMNKRHQDAAKVNQLPG